MEIVVLSGFQEAQFGTKDYPNTHCSCYSLEKQCETDMIAYQTFRRNPSTSKKQFTALMRRKSLIYRVRII